ncbi:GNAT family N-acetyltransferase [Solwaraspora sp. WMMD1047]|uniref:GNAT family N-acetyltransferase n=1 Tax=Solwaraspora sp. WMMD1047 TaxID=3016102 RepID=UPI002416578F|nr:GNAT family N-acetyltransferase [Solwaraspora sp. WMMD1047]MDG4829949.1 GNAT family N-acetyltransferase [Solwaraspora sp. WMMD1047]
MDRTRSEPIRVELLADRPDLLISLARIRWREWGDEPGREDLQWHIDATRRETGRTALPVTFVATDGAGEAVGGVGLTRTDLPELADRGPWVVGAIVHPQRRGYGIGTALVTSLKQWSIRTGIGQLWVATGGRAIDFYRRCGFDLTEVFTLSNGESPTILHAQLPGMTHDAA